MTQSSRFLVALFALGLCFSSTMTAAAVPASEAQTLFRNVRIFNGTSDKLSAPSNVLVKGQTIERISVDPISVDAAMSVTVTVIEGEGRVLMPGLIDAHWHATWAAFPYELAATADLGYVHLAAGKQAESTLMRGFTAVRDLGGPIFGLKRAIDDGTSIGPRIYPSGAAISQTGGHADSRFPYEVPRAPNAPLSYSERIGSSAIADSADEVRLRAREQLMLGASQIKLMAGGGMTSFYDPIDVTQYTEAEIRAAVEAAENWGTYATVHAYTPRAIRMAIAAGVKCIEHGNLADEATAKLMAEKGIWWSMQPFFEGEFAKVLTGARGLKQREVWKGTDNAYKLAKKYKIKTAWGADFLFDPASVAKQGTLLALMTRWYTPAETLQMATAGNAELLALSGPRNPYPGKLGVVQEGALADLLLVDGNPLENIHLIVDPDKNFVVVMKNGKIYKNLLAQRGPGE